jgi:hypothetical protein
MNNPYVDIRIAYNYCNARGGSYEPFDFRLRRSYRRHVSGRGDSRSSRSYGASLVRGLACTRRR